MSQENPNQTKERLLALQSTIDGLINGIKAVSESKLVKTIPHNSLGDETTLVWLGHGRLALRMIQEDINFELEQLKREVTNNVHIKK